MVSGLPGLVLVIWLAYIASRLLARREVPELVGFLFVGAALGPSGLGVLNAEQLASLGPVTEIALAILMFVIGERVSRHALRAAHWALTAGLAQYFLAGVGVYFATQWVGADPVTSLLVATLAGAGAPLTVSSVVASRKAKGKYVGGLVSTHAVCDALAATVFAAVLPLAKLMADANFPAQRAFVDFLRLGIGGVVLGVAFGWLIARFAFQIESSGELLLFVLVHILVGWVIADYLELSLPLAALVAGSVAASITDRDFSQRLFRTMRTIEQPLYLMFFALAGASIHLGDLQGIGLLGLAYIVARVLGKFAGSVLGGPLGGLKWPTTVRLGLDSIPQAGVAVGLAVQASEEIPTFGAEATAVVLGSVVVFELVGPLLLTRGLKRTESAAEAESQALSFDAPPTKVIFASHLRVAPPDWFLRDLHRWDAAVEALVPFDTEDPDHSELREAFSQADVDLTVHRYIHGESFTGAVVRLANEISADFALVVATRGSRPPGSRLVLLPYERIVRQLECPVIVYQVAAEEDYGE
ncbi:MAG: cation:proton antiporter [Acidimicrobiales bacterium]